MKRKRKHHHEEEHDGGERWLVSYADFITLLFAFFVVMYATSTKNTEKEKKFEDSIRQNMSLGAGPGAGAGSGSAQSAAPSANIAQQEGMAPSGQMQQQSRLANNADVQEKMESEITEKMTGEEKKLVTSVRHDLFGVRMSLAASTVFPTASAKIKREALPALDKVAQIMKKSSFKMLVEGHTDDQPLAPGSGFDSNWELASARATQVVRYLTKVRGISPDRLAAVSYADQRPLTPNVDEESRAKNRRIEILFITGDSPYDDF